MDPLNDVKVGKKRYGDYTYHWILITIKAIVIVAYLGFNLFVRKAIVPFVHFLDYSGPVLTSQEVHREHSQPPLHENHASDAGIHQLLMRVFRILQEGVCHS